jgi:DNA-directed RNA polymerase subunit RPC12/RpoP
MIKLKSLLKEAEKMIKCEECGWEWKDSEGGPDKYLCHKCGHNNLPINESVNQSKVRNQYDKIIDGIKKITKSLNDDEVDALHDMLKKFFNKGI